MIRQQIAAGNWKMNNDFREGLKLSKAIASRHKRKDVLIILGVPYIHLQAVGVAIKKAKLVKLAAQNCHQETSGAYTGEISVNMLKSVGADYVILGHSERRQYFDEGNKLIAAKVDKVLDAGLQPIFCCGEPLDIRKAKKHKSYVSKQIREGLFHLSPKAFKDVVIAYEPIWAIGTGVTASPDQAQEMHAYIRKLIEKKYSPAVANACSILYGGSVKPANAKEIFGKPDVDGGLVGGASLKAGDFMKIVKGF